MYFRFLDDVMFAHNGPFGAWIIGRAFTRRQHRGEIMMSTIVLLRSVNFLIPGVERVQALADISRSALCCHSNETRSPIANPPNSAQLDGTLYHSQVTSGYAACSSVGTRRGTDRQTHRQTHTQRHTDGRDQYTFRLGYASHEM